MPQPGTIWLTFGPRAAAIVWTLFLCSLWDVLHGEGRRPYAAHAGLVPLVRGGQLGDGRGNVAEFVRVDSAIRIWWRTHTRWITKVKFTLVGAACVVLSLLRLTIT